MRDEDNFMTFEILKGTNDYLPKDQIVINEILSKIREGFELYGFRPFDTPIIEYFETLANKYDEDAEIVQEIFKVSDRGDRNLGLRYDLTVPLCRFVASQKQIKLPFKRYQIGKVFRDGPIKPGRLREFTQCDGDVVGISGVPIEAELLMMFYDTYRNIGIDAIIEINNNKILRGALLQSGFNEDDLATLILSIDKLKKIGMDGVLREIEDKGFNKENAKAAIEILSLTSIDEIKKLAKDDELVAGVNEIEELSSLIEGSVKYRINFSMARGLAIYTGNIWEAYDFEEKISSSIGSGGRYDKVIGSYADKDEIIPAVGVSFGLIPILECIKYQGQKEGVTEVLVVPLDESLIREAFMVASKFRKVKINSEVYYGYKLKKAFDYADYLGASEIAIIGKQDVENGQFTLRNLETKEEKKLDL